jgi:hypothetical protein
MLNLKVSAQTEHRFPRQSPNLTNKGISPNIDFLEKVFKNDLVVPDFEAAARDFVDIYKKVRAKDELDPDNRGKVVRAKDELDPDNRGTVVRFRGTDELEPDTRGTVVRVN